MPSTVEKVDENLAMKTPRIALALFSLAYLGVAVPGCQREAAPRFVASEEVIGADRRFGQQLG